MLTQIAERKTLFADHYLNQDTLLNTNSPIK